MLIEFLKMSSIKCKSIALVEITLWCRQNSNIFKIGTFISRSINFGLFENAKNEIKFIKVNKQTKKKD